MRPDLAESVRVEVDRPHARGDRALDVEPDAIADVHGAPGRRRCGLAGGGEDARIGLLGADNPESTTAETGAPGPGPTWHTPSSHRCRSIQPCEFDTITTRHPAATMVRSAATESGTTVVHEGVPASKTLASASTTSARPGGTPSASRNAAMYTGRIARWLGGRTSSTAATAR